MSHNSLSERRLRPGVPVVLAALLGLAFLAGCGGGGGGGGNRAPVAQNQTVPGAVKGGPAVTITLHATDADGDAFTFEIVADLPAGRGTLNTTNVATGTVLYNPPASYSGSTSFTFRAVDANDAASNTATVTIPIHDNTAPVAQAQTVNTVSGTPPTAITLVAVDADSDAFTFAIATPLPGGKGALGVLNPETGAVTYDPQGFVGTTQFSFRAIDYHTAAGAPATVTIHVRDNTGPTADTQAVTTDENTPLTITLTGADADGDPLTFTLETDLSLPGAGTLGAITPVDDTSATILYTPVETTGAYEVSFTFSVSDGYAVPSLPATVTITVTDENQPPTADGVTVAALQDTPVTIHLSGSDPEGAPLAFYPESGRDTLDNLIVTGNTTATIEYTPATGFTGPDSFTYSVADDQLLESDLATVSVTVYVAGTNLAPVAEAQTVRTVVGATPTITLAASDLNGDTYTFSIAAALPAGEGSLDLTNVAAGTVIYDPQGFTGTTQFSFRATDEHALAGAPAVVTLEVRANTAPVADGQVTATDDNTPLVITLTGSDDDGDPLTFALATGLAPAGTGSLSGITPTGDSSAEITYTPATATSGAYSASFTFTVSDGYADSPAATVTIDVADAP